MLKKIVSIAAIVIGSLFILAMILELNDLTEIAVKNAKYAAGVGIVLYSFVFVVEGWSNTKNGRLIEFIINCILALFLMVNFNDLFFIQLSTANIFGLVFIIHVFFYIWEGRDKTFTTISLALGVWILTNGVTKVTDHLDFLNLKTTDHVVVFIACIAILYAGITALLRMKK